MMSDTTLIQPRQGRHHVFLPTEVVEHLDSLKSELDARSRPEVIRHLLQFYNAERKLGKEGVG